MIYFKIEYFNKLFNLWIPYDIKKYSSLQAAQNEITSYKNHKLGVKLRIVKTEIIK